MDEPDPMPKVTSKVVPVEQKEDSKPAVDLKPKIESKPKLEPKVAPIVKPKAAPKLWARLEEPTEVHKPVATVIPWPKMEECI